MINGLYNLLRIDEWIVKLENGIIRLVNYIVSYIFAWCIDFGNLVIE